MCRALVLAAIGLWLAADLFILTSVGLQSWPLVTGWLAVACLVVVLSFLLRRRLWARATAAVIMIPVFVLLAFEGGLLHLPAAVFLAGAAVCALVRARRAA